MLFTDIEFWIIFLIFLTIYWSSISSNIRTILTLSLSLGLYASLNLTYVPLLLMSTLLDFYIGKWIYQSGRIIHKRLLVMTSLGVNIGLLVYFKYFEFILQVLSDLTGNNFRLDLNIILPIGISFYTFQTLSYSLDIYREKLVPENSFITFANFVLFFPQLVAGPIERASNLLPQLKIFNKINSRDIDIGIKLILYGLFKKLIIANSVALFVDDFWLLKDFSSPIITILAIVGFSIQIYADFSGYSDIAIGLGRLMGIELMQNFNRPYFSRNIREFWSRWHISLSSWFKDYVFIPLGGSRSNNLNVYRNILIVFILSALWHGANYTFIVWGLIHVIAYFLFDLLKLNDTKRIVGVTLTFMVVSIAWVFFRAPNLFKAAEVLKSLINSNIELNNVFNYVLEIYGTQNIIVLSTSLILFFYVEIWIKDFSLNHLKMHKATGIGMSWGITLILLINLVQDKQFIYFQF